MQFRNKHQKFWAVRGKFDTTSDPTGNLVIVKRLLGDETVVSIVNTSGSDVVKLPAEYASGWQVSVSQHLNAGELAPFGFLVAARSRN